MNDPTRRVERDPVVVGWNRFRRVLRRHARIINTVAVLVWIALVVLMIVDHGHAYPVTATVVFVLSVLVTLAAPTRHRAGRSSRAGRVRRLPGRAVMSNILRSRWASKRR